MFIGIIVFGQKKNTASIAKIRPPVLFGTVLNKVLNTSW